MEGFTYSIQQELYWEIITEKGSVGNFRSIPLNREKDTEKKKLEINWFDLFCSVFGCWRDTYYKGLSETVWFMDVLCQS